MRTFYIETRNGAQVCEIKGRNAADALNCARRRYKEPTAGWSTTRVFMMLTPEALAALKAAKSAVDEHLTAFPNVKCPEGCAGKARAAVERQDWATAAEWYSAASGVSIGHSRSQMYDEERRRMLAKLDPEWHPQPY